MNTDKIYARERQSYEAPSVTPLEVLGEGVLCGSFHANTIEDAYEDDWETL